MQESQEKAGEEPDAKKKKVLVPDDALSEKAVLPGISTASTLAHPVKDKPHFVRLQPVTDFRKQDPPPPRRETRGLTHTDGPTSSTQRLGRGINNLL